MIQNLCIHNPIHLFNFRTRRGSYEDRNDYFIQLIVLDRIRRQSIPEKERGWTSLDLIALDRTRGALRAKKENSAASREPDSALVAWSEGSRALESEFNSQQVARPA